MKTARLLTALTLSVSLAQADMHAASISIPNLTQVTANSDVVTQNDVKAANGGVDLVSSADPIAYVITTFNWGANSNAHLRVRFGNGPTSENRLGIEVNDDGGLGQVGGNNGGFMDYDALTDEPRSVPIQIGGVPTDMAGTSITLLFKYAYDATNNVTYNVRAGNNSSAASDDTLMNVWVNPTGTSVEGSGPTAGDFYAIWNSRDFEGFFPRISNAGTSPAAGLSSITNTTILTGTDATFANALALAVPEPGSLALLGLGGLMIARRRRG